MASKYTTVSIPTELAGKVKEQIKGTGFKNLSDCVTYILREVSAKKEVNPERVKEKLRALGYL